jgi:hypothetical protein
MPWIIVFKVELELSDIDLKLDSDESAKLFVMSSRVETNRITCR